jgi:hypothetical protein
MAWGCAVGWYSMRHSVQVLCTLLLFGCAAAPPPVTGRSDLVSFVEDGKTSRIDAVSKLGSAYASYEGDRILIWRMTKDAGGYVVASQHVQPGQPQWVPNYELVLVFDAEGVVKRHALVVLRPAK